MACTRLLIFSCILAYAYAHGRLNNPPNRASLWRFGYKTPANYDDDGLNCGGFHRQHEINGGKCGICGDAYDLKQPRPHELGGLYGLGHIVATYEAGQIVNINIYLSASHLGFWELRICSDPDNQNQECFNNGHLLQLEEGGTKYYPTRGSGSYDLTYRLPSGFTCEHCVLQWQYTAGNNWGVCADGTGKLGCGKQEQFYSCADISIEDNFGSNDIENGLKDADTKDTPSKLSALSSIELDLLIRRMQLAGYHVFTGNDPVISPKSTKKHKKNHRRKKKSKKNKKSRRKRYERIIYWRR